MYRPKSKAVIARNMSAIRSRGNRTETALRKLIHRMGYRYRKYAKHLPGKPDFVFPAEKVAVFVDGDYWHGRLLREKGVEAVRERMKTSNKTYWIDKFRRNTRRDTQVTNALEREGWAVVRLWESDVKRDLDAAAREVVAVVMVRRSYRGRP